MDIIRRFNMSKSDDYGIDPLLDESFAAIPSIPASRNHVVTWDEKGRPDYISYKEYKTTDLWWVLMIYNKVFNIYDIREGLTLDIPDYATVMSVLNRTVKYGGTTSISSTYGSVTI